jgi:GTPase SAR1 family protein
MELYPEVKAHAFFFDTAGNTDYRDFTATVFKQADLCLIVFDVNDRDSFRRFALGTCVHSS